MADIKWIKLSLDVFNSRKIKQIEKMPDGDTIIVIWFKLLVLAGAVNDCGQVYFTPEMPYTDEMLATEFDRPISTVRMALGIFQQFGMIEVINDILCLPQWEKYQNVDALERAREKNAARQQAYRDRQKALTAPDDSNVTRNVTDNVTVTEHNAAERRKKKEEYSAFFEEIWKLYPCKKGKGQVSDTKKKVLYEIGLEEMTRAINRYVEDLEKDEWRKAQNGSTFFSSGYIDYLDANYSGTETAEAKHENTFAQLSDI